MRIIEDAGEVFVQVPTIRDRDMRLYVVRFGQHMPRRLGWLRLTRGQWDRRPGVDQTSTLKPLAQRKAEAQDRASHCVECGKEMDRVEAGYSLTCGKCRRTAYLPVRNLSRKGTDQAGRPARPSDALAGAPLERAREMDDEGEAGE